MKKYLIVLVWMCLVSVDSARAGMRPEDFPVMYSPKTDKCYNLKKADLPNVGQLLNVKGCHLTDLREYSQGASAAVVDCKNKLNMEVIFLTVKAADFTCKKVGYASN